ncbi:MAG TPA: hypothetical protein VFN04_03450 [Protaetiibacter sp.]|nr:hypothetical protein [Protaetiibacter sp.]
MLLAHFAASGSGVVDLPAWALAYGVFAASVIAILWSRSRHVARAPAPDTPVPARLTRSGPVTALTTGAQLVLLAVVVVLVLSAWTGSTSIGQNLAPLTVIGVYWSMGAWLSLVAGPFWQTIDPFAVFARLGARRRTTRGRDDPPNLAPWWAPAIVLGSFTIAWVAWFDGDLPRNLAVWLTAYVGSMAVLAYRRGRTALDAFDALPAALDLAGAILWPRRFRARLVDAPSRRRVGLVAALLLAAIGVDRAMSTGWYVDQVAPRTVVLQVGINLAMIAAATAAIVAVWNALGRLVSRARGEAHTFPLAASLAPAAAAVLLARGLTTGLIQSQNLVVLASDPMSRGWNLFGTIYWQVSQEPLSPFARGIIQATVLLAGHVAALCMIGRAATARGADGATTLRARHAAWTASLPAMAVVVVGGIVWTLLLLGQ